MTDLTNIKSLGIDVETALERLDQDVKRIKTDSTHLAIFEYLAKGIIEHDSELYSLFCGSAYGTDFISKDALASINGIVAITEAVKRLVYDLVDDGEVYLVKVETVGAKHTSPEDPAELVPDLIGETVKWFIWNSDVPSTLDKIRSKFNKSFNIIHSSNFKRTYDGLKVSYCDLDFEHFKKIFQILDSYKARFEKHKADFCQKTGIPLSNYAVSVKLSDPRYDLQRDAWCNEPVLDFSEVSSEWDLLELKRD